MAQNPEIKRGTGGKATEATQNVTAGWRPGDNAGSMDWSEASKVNDDRHAHGSVLNEATDPEMGWERCGYMVAHPVTNWPSVSATNLRNAEYQIKDGRDYVDPLQKLPPRQAGNPASGEGMVK